MNWLRFEEKKLATLSSEQVAATLWENLSVKEDIRNFSTKLNKNRDSIDQPSTTMKWWKITQKIITRVEYLNIPQALSFKLKRLIILRGEKILNWILNVLSQVSKKDIIFDCNYFEKIYWTADGLIDELKIFQFWREEYPNFPGFADYYRNKLALYNLACYYWDEEYLEGGLEEIRGIIDLCFGVKDINTVEDAMDLISRCQTSDKWCSTLVLPDKNCFLLRGFGRPHSNYVLYNHMTDLYPVNEGFFKYRYKKVDEEEKHEFLLRGFYRVPSMSSDGPKNHKSAKMMLMLLNLSNPIKLNDYILLKIFNIFLRVWPYQNLCVQFLDCIWNNVWLYSLLRILENTLRSVNFSTSEYKEAYSVVQLKVLKKILARIPPDEKFRFFTNQLNIKMYVLFKKSAYSSINIIINDAYLKKFKYELLDISKQMPHYFNNNGQLENLKEYTFKYFSDEEQEKFFSNDLFARLICGDLFDTADEILKWRCNSQEKINERKNNIHSESVFLTLFMHESRYVLIDKYFTWACGGSPDLAGDLKSKIFAEDFIRLAFWHVWVKYCKKDLPSTVERCTSLLKYFLKTDEEIILFKKKKIVENFAKTLCDVLLNFQKKRFLQPKRILDLENSCWPDLDEVFKFCSISEDDIKRMKQEIKSDFDFYYNSYSNNMYEILVLNSLVKWLWDTDEEKGLIIKKYLDPDATAKFLYLTICKTENGINAFTKAGETVFLRDWVSKYGNISQIKEKVKSIENIRERDVILITERLGQFYRN